MECNDGVMNVIDSSLALLSLCIEGINIVSSLQMNKY